MALTATTVWPTRSGVDEPSVASWRSASQTASRARSVCGVGADDPRREQLARRRRDLDLGRTDEEVGRGDDPVGLQHDAGPDRTGGVAAGRTVTTLGATVAPTRSATE